MYFLYHKNGTIKWSLFLKCYSFLMVSLCYLESVTIDGSFDEAMFSDADVGTRAGKISLQRLGGESGA